MRQAPSLISVLGCKAGDTMVDGGGPQAQLRPLDLWWSPRVETLAAERLREPGGVVGLDSALGTSQCAQLGGIGQVGGEPPALDLLHHEAPTGRALESEVGIGPRL